MQTTPTPTYIHVRKCRFVCARAYPYDAIDTTQCNTHMDNHIARTLTQHSPSAAHSKRRKIKKKNKPTEFFHSQSNRCYAVLLAPPNSARRCGIQTYTNAWRGAMQCLVKFSSFECQMCGSQHNFELCWAPNFDRVAMLDFFPVGFTQKKTKTIGIYCHEHSEPHTHTLSLSFLIATQEVLC